MTKSRQLAYLALTANALIWGSAFPIIKPALGLITPMQYLYWRFLVAGLCALPIFLFFYLKLRPKLSYIIKVLLIELGGTVIPLLILYEGLSRTTALEASLIGATGPIFIVLGSMFFLHERESQREWQGLALAFAGSLLIILEPLWNGHGLVGSLSGNLLILFYNLVYTVYVLTVKKVFKRSPPLYLGSLTYLATALIYSLLLSQTDSLLSFEILYSNFDIFFPVLYMALPGSVLAFALYLFAQSKIEVSEANLFTYLNGVVAIPTSYLLLGETPTPLNLLAILLIAYGVFRAERRTS